MMAAEWIKKTPAHFCTGVEIMMIIVDYSASFTQRTE